MMCVKRWHTLPSRQRRRHHRGSQNGRLVKLKFSLTDCSASTQPAHGSFPGLLVPWHFLASVDICFVPIVGFEALRT